MFTMLSFCIIFNYMYVWVCASGHGCPWRPGDGPECPGAGVNVCCEPPDRGAEMNPGPRQALNHGAVSPGPIALFTLAGHWGIVFHSMGCVLIFTKVPCFSSRETCLCFMFFENTDFNDSFHLSRFSQQFWVKDFFLSVFK